MIILTDKSRQGIEVKSVLPTGKKSSVSGKTRNLDKKETIYDTVDFNDIIFNSKVSIMIETEKSVSCVKLTPEGIEKTLFTQCMDYISKFEKEIEVALSRKYNKNHTKLIKTDDEHISDFSQLIEISKEKSKEILNKNGFNKISELSKKLQDKIILEQLI